MNKPQKSVLCLRIEYENDEQIPAIRANQVVAELGGKITGLSWLDILEENDRLTIENQQLRDKIHCIQTHIEEFRDHLDDIEEAI